MSELKFEEVRTPVRSQKESYVITAAKFVRVKLLISAGKSS